MDSSPHTEAVRPEQGPTAFACFILKINIITLAEHGPSSSILFLKGGLKHACSAI